MFRLTPFSLRLLLLATSHKCAQIIIRLWCYTNHLFSYSFVWLGGTVVRALDLRLEVAGSNPSRCTVECNLGQVVHTHCPAPLVLQPYGAI